MGIRVLIDDARKWLVFARGEDQVRRAMITHARGRWGAGVTVKINVHPDDTEYVKIDDERDRFARVKPSQWVDTEWQRERIKLTARYLRLAAAKANRETPLATVEERLARCEHLLGVFNG